MPQGGVIGPLPFIVYINDVVTEINISSNIHLLAYHTNIFSQSNNILQLSFYKMYHWLETRKLKLNPNKCQVPNIHKNKSNSTDFKINSIKLPSIKVFKDLGIYIAKNTKLNNHIIYVYTNLSTKPCQVLKMF